MSAISVCPGREKTSVQTLALQTLVCIIACFNLDTILTQQLLIVQYTSTNHIVVTHNTTLNTETYAEIQGRHILQGQKQTASQTEQFSLNRTSLSLKRNARSQRHSKINKNASDTREHTITTTSDHTKHLNCVIHPRSHRSDRNDSGSVHLSTSVCALS